MPKNSILKLAVAVSMAGGYATCAHSQTAGTDSDADISSSLEEVIVTAQRREQRLVDVPISITALSGDEMLRSGITATMDLERVVPGLELTYNGGFLQPALRGVSSQGSSAGDSSNVAFYLDGVYQPSQPGQMMDLPDVQQVQVLKGPQGTLYGQNATGGAIIIKTVAPNLEELEGRISASYGNYDDKHLSGYVTGPFSDRVAGSLALSYQDRDGYRDDIVYGGEDEGLRSQLVRGKLLFEPTDSIALTLSGYYADRKDSSPYSGIAYEQHSIGYVLASYLPPDYPIPVPDWDETATSRKVDTENETWGTSLLAEFVFDIGTLSSTTSYTESDVLMDVDADYSFYHLADVTVLLEQDFFIQELNFASEQIGRWQFTAGLFYLNGTEEYVPNTFRTAFNPGPAPEVSEEEARLTPISFTYGYIDKEIWAAYAEVTFDLTDSLQLTVGGRYSDEEQKVAANYHNALSSETPESPYSPASFDKFTPRVTLVWALSEDSNIYASYGEGFKSGYLSVADAGNPPVEPEELTAYEVGYKGTLNDNLTISSSIFYYEYKDLQVARYEAPNYVYDNAAEASIQGADFDATWHATPNLTVMTGVSYLDAEYDDFPGATAFQWRDGAGNDTIDFDASGFTLIRAPDWTGFVNLDYRVQTGFGEIGLFGSAYYNDGYNLELTGAVAQDSYTMFDGELSLVPAAAPNLRLVLWGRNLSDEDVLQSLLATPFGDGVSYGAPRTYGLRLDYNL